MSDNPTDIVARLWDRSVEGNCVISDAGLMQAAADEIERLRAAAGLLADPATPATTDTERTIARELAALVRHYNYWFGDSCGCDEHPCPLAHQSEILAAADRIST